MDSMDCTPSAHGVLMDSMSTPCRVHMSAHGVHGNVWGSVKYSKNPTALINAYVIWSHIWCWIYCIQKIQDLCWRFRFVKQCPSVHSTTWSTEGFHTIKTRRYKIIVSPAF